ncbi:hypothetical protein OGG44_001181 [Salmonella enterica]|nr:hypothetical protein [Salmonella enterica]
MKTGSYKSKSKEYYIDKRLKKKSNLKDKDEYEYFLVNKNDPTDEIGPFETLKKAEDELVKLNPHYRPE